MKSVAFFNSATRLLEIGTHGIHKKQDMRGREEERKGGNGQEMPRKERNAGNVPLIRTSNVYEYDALGKSTTRMAIEQNGSSKYSLWLELSPVEDDAVFERSCMNLGSAAVAIVYDTCNCLGGTCYSPLWYTLY